MLKSASLDHLSPMKRLFKTPARHSFMPKIWLFDSNRKTHCRSRAIVPQLRAGTGFVFRRYHHPNRLAEAKDMAILTRQHRLHFHFATHPGIRALPLAILSNGLHLRASALRFPALARWGIALRERRRCCLSVAVHAPDEWRQALKLHRYRRPLCLFVSPVFNGSGHPKKIGRRFALFAWRRHFQTWPRKGAQKAHIAALGGIRPQRIRRLGQGMFHGYAAIRAFIPKTRPVAPAKAATITR